MHGKHLCLYLWVISGITGFVFHKFSVIFLRLDYHTTLSKPYSHPPTDQAYSQSYQYGYSCLVCYSLSKLKYSIVIENPWELTEVRYSQKELKSCSFYSKIWQTKPVRAGYSRCDKDYSVMVDEKKQKKEGKKKLNLISYFMLASVTLIKLCRLMPSLNLLPKSKVY